MTCKWRLIIFTSSAQSRLDARKRGKCIGVPTLLIFSRTFLPAKRYRMFLRMFSRFSLWSELELGSDSYSIHSTRRKYKKMIRGQRRNLFPELTYLLQSHAHLLHFIFLQQFASFAPSDAIIQIDSHLSKWMNTFVIYRQSVDILLFAMLIVAMLRFSFS